MRASAQAAEITASFGPSRGQRADLSGEPGSIAQIDHSLCRHLAYRKACEPVANLVQRTPRPLPTVGTGSQNMFYRPTLHLLNSTALVTARSSESSAEQGLPDQTIEPASH